MSIPALEIKDLQAWYGESHILHGISLTVHSGQVVTLLGRNGAGRTTTLRAIMGLTGDRKGSIKVHGTETIGLPTHRIAHLGIGYCPEERGIFAALTTEENLRLPPKLTAGRGKAMTEAELYAMFPNLQERRNSPGTRLSGGEQQMLAVARILRTGANLLLLDEITEGLAPVIVQRLGEVLTMLKSRGYTVIEGLYAFAEPAGPTVRAVYEALRAAFPDAGLPQELQPLVGAFNGLLARLALGRRRRRARRGARLSDPPRPARLHPPPGPGAALPRLDKGADRDLPLLAALASRRPARDRRSPAHPPPPR